MTLDLMLTCIGLMALRARERSERQPSCEAGFSSPCNGASVTLDPVLTFDGFLRNKMSSRAAKRHGDPGLPETLGLPVPGMKAKVKYHISLRGTEAWNNITALSLMLFAKTGYANVSQGRSHRVAGRISFTAFAT